MAERSLMTHPGLSVAILSCAACWHSSEGEVSSEFQPFRYMHTSSRSLTPGSETRAGILGAHGHERSSGLGGALPDITLYVIYWFRDPEGKMTSSRKGRDDQER